MAKKKPQLDSPEKLRKQARRKTKGKVSPLCSTELKKTLVELQTQRKELRVRDGELVRSETELGKVNRILRALSNSNQAMMRTADERQFLNDVCKSSSPVIPSANAPLI